MRHVSRGETLHHHRKHRKQTKLDKAFESSEESESGFYTHNAREFFRSTRLARYLSGQSLRSETGNQTQIRIAEDTGRLTVVIELSETTTTEDLRRAIPLALEWRDLLFERQGFVGWAGESEELMRFSSEIERKLTTYAAIAKKENALIAGCLHQYVYLHDFTHDKNPTIEVVTNVDEWVYLKDWKGVLNPKDWKDAVPDMYFEKAIERLELWRIKSETISEILNEGIKNIRNKDKPFPTNAPLTARKVRRVIDTWRNSPKGMTAIGKQRAGDAEI